jgi:signal transduction histidine kinase
MKRALFLATTVIALVVILMYSLIPGDVTAPTQDAGSIVIAFVAGIILVSYVGALIDVRRSVLASIESDVIRTQIEAAARRSALASITREMARSLHGSVQTRLVACAASIDQAQRTGDSGAVLQALDESASILAELGTGAQSVDEESLGISVDRLVDNWRAICEVNLRMDPALVGRNDLSHVARIVEEAMANSYRHGMAGCIEVDIRMMNDGSDVEIQIRDDGVGLTGNPPGLGRRIIAEYCGDRCELSRQGDWTVLRAIAPISLG